MNDELPDLPARATTWSAPESTLPPRATSVRHPRHRALPFGRMGLVGVLIVAGYLVDTHIVNRPPSSGGTPSTTLARVTTTTRTSPVAVSTTTLPHPRHHRRGPAATTTTSTTTTTTTTTTAPSTGTTIGIAASSHDTLTCPVVETFAISATGNGTVELSVTGAGGSYTSSGTDGHPVTLNFSGPAGTYYLTATASQGDPFITWNAAGVAGCTAN